MNSLENPLSQVLYLSPNELTKKLDYLKKLGGDCHAILDTMTLPNERRKYIKMLLEKKLNFANHLSGIEAPRVYLERLLENLRRVENGVFTLPLLRRITANLGNTSYAFGQDLITKDNLLAGDTLVEGIVSGSYSGILEEYEQYSRLYHAKKTIPGEIRSAIDTLGHDMIASGEVGDAVREALSLIQTQLSFVIENPEEKLKILVKESKNIDPHLLALMSENPEKILRLLGIDIEAKIDIFLILLVILDDDPRAIHQIVQKWEASNAIIQESSSEIMPTVVKDFSEEEDIIHPGHGISSTGGVQRMGSRVANILLGIWPRNPSKNSVA